MAKKKPRPKKEKKAATKSKEKNNGKKKKKRVMPFIQSRDVDIFRTMSSGPSTSAQIRNDLKKFPSRKEGNLDDKETDYSRDMSYNALTIRLSRLKRGNYIASDLYLRDDGRSEALYVLTPRAIDILVGKHGFNPKHIRNILPSQETASHELQVVSIVKTIKRDGGKLHYRYDIEDENYLKQKTQGAKKNVFYPDLYVKLSYDYKGTSPTRNLAVELDNGTMKPHLVAAKAHAINKANNWPSMFICPNPKRIDILRDGFAKYIESEAEKMFDEESKEEIRKLYGRVFFTTTYNFFEKGFLRTKWLMINEGETADVIPDK